MICQNCQANVDDDLIFCTNCGERLFETKSEAQTVLLNDSIVTKISVEKPQKSGSNAKWIALTVALIAIPASIFGVYLLTNSKQISQNINKTNTPVSTPTRKTNSNQNTNANISNSNANLTNIKANTNSANPTNKTEIMNERIEIAPKSHYALPFEVTTNTAEIVGKVEILQGEKIDGYVYSQEMYDNHFPDPNYKIFSFGDAKNVVVDQTLVEEKYVLVFINKTEKSVVIQGNFSVK